MQILRLILILTAILFILLQRVDVKIIRREKLTVKISFNLFAVVLTDGGEKKKSISQKIRYLKNARSVYRAAKHLISKSNISLQRTTEINEKTAVNSSRYLLLIQFSLFRLIISLLIFLYYTVKHKVKRGIKNV